MKICFPVSLDAGSRGMWIRENNLADGPINLTPTTYIGKKKLSQLSVKK